MNVKFTDMTPHRIIACAMAARSARRRRRGIPDGWILGLRSCPKPRHRHERTSYAVRTPVIFISCVIDARLDLPAPYAMLSFLRHVQEGRRGYVLYTDNEKQLSSPCSCGLDLGPTFRYDMPFSIAPLLFVPGLGCFTSCPWLL
jgi:hypothetical protein